MVMPIEMIALLNTMTTCACAIALTFVFQFGLVLAWRGCVNRRYYRHMRAVSAKAAEGAPPPKVPKFFPYPKSLIWPTPLYFSSCIFVTGLTRNSVKTLSSLPHEGCGALCVTLPIAVLVLLVSFLAFVVVDLAALRRRHKVAIKWKPAALQTTPAALGDPWMRWQAQLKVNAMAARALVETRVKERLGIRKTTSLRTAGLGVVAGVRSKRPWQLDSEAGGPALGGRGSMSIRLARTLLGWTRSSAGRVTPHMSDQDGSGGSQTHTTSTDGAPSAASEADAAAAAAAAAPAARAPASDEGAHPASLAARGEVRLRASMKDMHTSAIERLAERRGFRDRKSGTFGLPEDDTKEPARTERILSQPFKLWRSHSADAWQSREGYFFFRVNASTRFGLWYRVLVVAMNMAFGVISGLQPLLAPGSTAAFTQTTAVCALQLTMAISSFHFVPDADRIISRFASTQFLLEGLATALLLGESVTKPAANIISSEPLASSTNATEMGEPTASSDLEAGAGLLTVGNVGFFLSLGAMLTPMLQLLEQRLVTPAIGILKTKKVANPIALLAALYMLCISLPVKITKVVLTIGGYSDSNTGAAARSASADAGDDAVEVEAKDDCDGGENNDEDEDKKDSKRSASTKPGQGATFTAEGMGDASIKVSRLLARAVAAKESGGKAIMRTDSTTAVL